MICPCEICLRFFFNVQLLFYTRYSDNRLLIVAAECSPLLPPLLSIAVVLQHQHHGAGGTGGRWGAAVAHAPAAGNGKTPHLSFRVPPGGGVSFRATQQQQQQQQQPAVAPTTSPASAAAAAVVNQWSRAFMLLAVPCFSCDIQFFCTQSDIDSIRTWDPKQLSQI